MWNGFFLFSMGFHGELVLSRRIKIFFLFIYFVFWKISLAELDLFRQQFILQILLQLIEMKIYLLKSSLTFSACSFEMGYLLNRKLMCSQEFYLWSNTIHSLQAIVTVISDFSQRNHFDNRKFRSCDRVKGYNLGIQTFNLLYKVSNVFFLRIQ